MIWKKEQIDSMNSTSLLSIYTDVANRVDFCRRTMRYLPGETNDDEKNFKLLSTELSKRLGPDTKTTEAIFTKEEVLRLGEDHDQKVANDVIDIIKKLLIKDFRGDKISVSIENHKLSKIQVNKVKDYFENLGWLVEGGEFGNKFYLG